MWQRTIQGGNARVSDAGVVRVESLKIGQPEKRAGGQSAIPGIDRLFDCLLSEPGVSCLHKSIGLFG